MLTGRQVRSPGRNFRGVSGRAPSQLSLRQMGCLLSVLLSSTIHSNAEQSINKNDYEQKYQLKKKKEKVEGFKRIF